MNLYVQKNQKRVRKQPTEAQRLENNRKKRLYRKNLSREERDRYNKYHREYRRQPHMKKKVCLWQKKSMDKNPVVIDRRINFLKRRIGSLEKQMEIAILIIQIKNQFKLIRKEKEKLKEMRIRRRSLG